jgi:hypothetical protein
MTGTIDWHPVRCVQSRWRQKERTNELALDQKTAARPLDAVPLLPSLPPPP